MNILFFTRDIPYPISSGHHVRTFHYLQALMQKHQITIATFGDERADAAGIAFFKNAGCAVRLIEPKRIFKKHQRYAAILQALLTSLPYVVRMRLSRLAQQKLSQIVAQNQYDLFICDGIHLSLNLPENISCKKILDEHNVESMIIKRYRQTEKNVFKKLYAQLEYLKFIAFENRTWPRFDELHVCSEVDRSHIAGRISGPVIHVVPNPVDTDKFQPRPVTEKTNSLIYTGLMGWTPNVDAVVYFAREIYPLIKQSVPDVTFSIIGKNPAPAVQVLANNDTSVTVKGYVEDIAAEILQNAVFIVPLRIGSGTRLKILEAMALGKAIVSTAIGCEGLDVRHGENIMIADRPEDFSSAVIQLLQDPALRAKLGRNGRQLVEEKYSAKKMGEDLLRFIG